MYLIIGSGAAGLMAARTLSAAGAPVTVVEARGRIGGRIDTFTGSGFPGYAEGGAEFIHGDLPVTKALFAEAGFATKAVSGNAWHVENGHVEKGGMFHEDWDDLMDALNNLKADTTMGTFLRQYFSDSRYASLAETVRRFAEGYDAADLEQVSAFALREEWAGSEDKDQYRPAAGYAAVLRYLEKQCIEHGVTFHFDKPVKKIAWSAGEVILHMGNGDTLRGNKVLVTVPVGVLQAEAIDFAPAVPHIVRAARGFGFGGVIKFLFAFRRRFWEEKDSGFRHMPGLGFLFSDASVPTWWTQQPDETPVLTGWLAGPGACHTDHDTDALFNKALHSLAYLFDTTEAVISKEIAAWQIMNWFQDPYARGAYAYTTLDTSAARETLGTPLANTLFFAGEALYAGPAMGTVEAALASGQDTARKMLATV